MWFVPYRKLIFKTRLGKVRALHKIGKITYTYPNILASWFLSSPKHYHGTVDADGFQIQRVVSSSRVVFFPLIIKGFIGSELGESTITVTIWPSISLLTALVSGILMCGLVVPDIVTGFLHSGHLDFNNDFFVFGFFLFLFYLFPMFAFNREANRSKTFLQKVLKAYDVEELGLFQREDLM
jgi:hypothetical protein